MKSDKLAAQMGKVLEVPGDLGAGEGSDPTWKHRRKGLDHICLYLPTIF